MPYKLFGISALRHPLGAANFRPVSTTSPALVAPSSGFVSSVAPGAMQISVPTETAAREKRVGIAPDSIVRFKKLGVEVVVQQGAGLAAGFRDDAYVAAGARIAPDAKSALEGATIVARVQPPSSDEIALLPEGATLISLMRPGQNDGLA